MSTGWIVLIVVLVILIGVLVGLYFFGKKAEKKQAAQQEHVGTSESFFLYIKHCDIVMDCVPIIFTVVSSWPA